MQLHPLIIQQYECSALRNVVPTRAFDDDSFDIPMFDDWNAADESSAYVFSSSDGEDYDGEVFLTPVNDIDLPSVSASNDDAVTVAAHRFATLGRGQKKPRIVRLPLSPFYLTRPFLISAFLVSFAGYVGIPIFRLFKFIHVIKQQGPASHRTKKLTPTLGGLLFVPIGIIVAHVYASSSSTEVSGAAGATIAFAAVGLLSDILSLTNHRRVLPVLTEVLLQEDAGSSAIGPRVLGKIFVSMGHGVKLADAIDGLAGGTAALAFTGMSIAVLPKGKSLFSLGVFNCQLRYIDLPSVINTHYFPYKFLQHWSERKVSVNLAIFGASMAGSCVGFLLHNRYKASIFMGHTGSLALGGGLAAMASCTGMFFPLLISSGIFVVESLSVIIQEITTIKMDGSGYFNIHSKQLLYLKITKSFRGGGWRLLRIPPFHYRLQLRGFREPNIVLGAYLISSILALLGGYVGLVSA
ncbi:hypothetical protein V8G54_032834 [Vigna mungo]|uniref:Uncharacterized protein n=1 Tax=Vigna mungo TaxID=3915 RepID=A0AAQ3RH20_VIGMU